MFDDYYKQENSNNVDRISRVINIFELISKFSSDINDPEIIKNIVSRTTRIQKMMENKITGDIRDKVVDFFSLVDYKTERNDKYQPVVNKCKGLLENFKMIEEPQQNEKNEHATLIKGS